MSGIGLDPGDDELSRAQHQVRLLQQQVLTLRSQVNHSEHLVRKAHERAADADREVSFALRLRDDSAREHEREAARRREVEGVLEEIRSNAARHGDAWVEQIVAAHLGRQGETT